MGYQMVTGVALVVALLGVAVGRTPWAESGLRLSRIAYGLFIVLGLLYFPEKAGFQVTSPICEWKFDLALAVHSLTNYRHIILFTFFFLLTYAQLPGVRGALIWSAAASMTMGLLVELAQGTTGEGHCRMRDLIPDAVGALAGATLVLAGRRVTRTPS